MISYTIMATSIIIVISLISWESDKLEYSKENEETLYFTERLLLIISFIIKNISYTAIGDLIKIMGLTKE